VSTRGHEEEAENPLEIIFHEVGLSPMQRLWGAVVFRAFQDLQAGDPRAVRFFQDPESNFSMACHFLTWEPSKIRKKLQLSGG